jgi:hypothetical protein
MDEELEQDVQKDIDEYEMSRRKSEDITMVKEMNLR